MGLLKIDFRVPSTLFTGPPNLSEMKLGDQLR